MKPPQPKKGSLSARLMKQAQAAVQRGDEDEAAELLEAAMNATVREWKDKQSKEKPPSGP